MRLRTRVLAIVAIIMVTFALVLLAVVGTTLQGDYASLEMSQQQYDIKQGMEALNTQIGALRVTSIDYATWDDTYEFAVEPYQEYVESNFVNTTYESLGISLAIIYNYTDVVYAGEYDKATGQVITPSDELIFSAVNVISSLRVPSQGAAGLAWLMAQRSMISCMPILQSDGGGPSHGWVIMATWIDAGMETQLSVASGYPVTFVVTDYRLTAAQMQVVWDGVMAPVPLSSELAVLAVGLKDLGGANFSLFEMTVDRPGYQQGQTAIGLLWQSVAIMGVALMAIFLLVMHITVTKRVEDLDDQVEAVSNARGEPRMHVDGDDEISHLAQSINTMLISIESGYRRLGDEKMRYHNMIDSQVEAIARLDQEMRIIIHNASFARLVKRPDVEGRDFFESLGLSEGTIRQDLMNLQGSGDALGAEFVLPGADGPTYQRWTFSALFEGVRREYQVVGQDVTALKKAEAELAEYRSHLEHMVSQRTRELSMVNTVLQKEIAGRAAAENRYRGVIEDQTELVFRFIPEGDLTFSNSAYHEFTGGDEGLDIDEDGEEKVIAALRSLDEGAESAHVEVNAASHGEMRKLSMTLRVISGDNDFTEVQAVARDITEMAQLEAERIKAQQMAWLGTISASLAHEINNQMMTALGKIRLAEKTRNVEEATSMLREAEQCVLRSGRTMRRLLAFSQGGEPLKELVMVRDLLEMSAEAAEGPMERIAIDEDGGSVRVDKAQMSEALAAIIKDCLEASAPSGMVRVLARKRQDALEVRITDEGRGMPPEVLAKAFEPFFTTHEGRAGLGLPTAALIIQKHGGTIQASSSPGRGTEFRILLRDAEGTPEIMPSVPRRDARILLMDDDESILEVIQALMEESGYDVDTALDGKAALQLYEAAMRDRPYKAVVMDLLVHHGMGGKDAIKSILLTDPGAKVIVASGYSDDPIMANYAAYGFYAALYKPYRIEDLIGLIERIPDR
jgi:signal transduction histidine kinase/sensor domain CHASE-containing protein/CheY-like chemotaxis protein